MDTKITVSGNIVKELSEKIPSNIIALNELIKNAYDAGSKQVDIRISTDEKKLSIKDYGIGMDKEDVKKLFHISSSEKKYGKVINVNELERTTQGSKGLGFLSVFKFGDTVKWKTSKGKTLEFLADYNDILNKEDISGYHIEINELNEEFIGTEITIALNQYNTVSLPKYFSEEKNREKLLNSFICLENNSIKPDDNFVIKLEIDNESYQTDLNLSLKSESPEQQLIRIKYDSVERIIKYYSNQKENDLLYSESMDFDSEEYSVALDLQTFVLKSYGKEKISKFFWHPVSDELTPLVYVNNNLFSNYELFDTNLMKTKKYGNVMSQMIGFVSIISSNAAVDFNSDRTKFVQNELTDSVSEFLKKLNERIQTTSSELKNELRGKDKFLVKNEISEEMLTDEFDCSSLIKEDFKVKPSITIEKKKDTIVYKLFDKEEKVLIKQKEKKKSVKDIKFYYSKLSEKEREEISSELSNFDTIKFEGKTVASYDFSNAGQWEFIKEDDSQVFIKRVHVLSPQQPKVTQKKEIVRLNEVYSYDDLFDFENSFCEKDKGIAPILYTEEIKYIRNDKNNGTISFGREGEMSFIVCLKDKKTEKTHKMQATFEVVSKSIRQSKTEENFIKMPISNGDNLSHNILSFISELNTLKGDNKFSYSFVASYRTLVELCVIDILNKKKIEKDEILSKNYEKVLELYPDYVENIQDNKDRQIISNIYRTILPQDEKNAFLSFLNLCTHGSSSMILKDEIAYKTRELTLLLEYLSFLSKG